MNKNTRTSEAAVGTKSEKEDVDLMDHLEETPRISIHYDFKPVESSCLRQKDVSGSLRQW